MLNAYDVLGVVAGANRDEIRAAYVSLAKQLHPDRNVGSERAKLQFQKVNQAYELLKDTNRRSAYDRHLGLMQGEIRRHRRRAAGVVVASFTLTSVVVSALLFLSPFLLLRDTPKLAGDDNRVRSAHHPSFASDPDGLVVAKREAAPSPMGDMDGVKPNRDVPIPSLQPAAGTDPVALLIDRYPAGVETEAARAKLAQLIELTTDQSFLQLIVDHGPPSALTERAKDKLAALQAWSPTARGAGKRHAWVTYHNDRFGFALDYPAEEFTAEDRGLGEFWRLFISRDGQARLLVTAGFNAKGVTAASYRQSLMNEVYGGANLEYAPLRKTWFVRAGSQGEEMFYERATFACDGRIIHGWRLTYPSRARDHYSQIIERMHQGYNHVRGAGRHCDNRDIGKLVGEVRGVRRGLPQPGG
jgi:hypothetical protein